MREGSDPLFFSANCSGSGVFSLGSQPWWIPFPYWLPSCIFKSYLMTEKFLLLPRVPASEDLCCQLYCLGGMGENPFLSWAVQRILVALCRTTAGPKHGREWEHFISASCYMCLRKDGVRSHPSFLWRNSLFSLEGLRENQFGREIVATWSMYCWDDDAVLRRLTLFEP